MQLGPVHFSFRLPTHTLTHFEKWCYMYVHGSYYGYDSTLKVS